MPQDAFDTTTILNLRSTEVSDDLDRYISIFAHPINERSYHDSSGFHRHLISIEILEGWLKDPSKVYINDKIRGDLELVKKLMINQHATYFRILKP